MQRYRILLELGVEDLQLVLQQVRPLGDLRERQAELAVLRVVPAGPDADLDPAAAHLVDRGNDFGERSGVAKRDRRNERAEADGRGLASDAGENGPRVGGRLVSRPGEAPVVIGPEKCLESKPFDQPGNLQLLHVCQALLGLDHEGKAH